MVKLTKRNYVDRDVSWMYFNHRILEEAQREDIPVLERMAFLGIYSNNLDEFFRVRMANLREDRADVIVPAAQLFLMVAGVVNTDSIIVPTLGLADGIINELVEKEFNSYKNR